MRAFYISFPSIASKELQSYFKVTEDDVSCFGDTSQIIVNIQHGESVLEELKHISFHYPDMPFDVLAEPNEPGWGKEEEYIEYYHRNGKIITIAQSDKMIPIMRLRTMSYAEIKEAIRAFDEKMNSFETLSDAVKNYKEVKCVGC